MGDLERRFIGFFFFFFLIGAFRLTLHSFLPMCFYLSTCNFFFYPFFFGATVIYLIFPSFKASALFLKTSDPPFYQSVTKLD